MDTVEQRAAALAQQAQAGGPTLGRPAPDPFRQWVKVYDDVLARPLEYRAEALALEFRSVPVGPITFHGIAGCHTARLPQWIQTLYPDAKPGLSFFRRSPLGQEEPNFIHTDRDMGDWTGILYLNPRPLPGDGTTFWSFRETGAVSSVASTVDEALVEGALWRKRDLWFPRQSVAAKFNRLVLFHAPMFHSRAIDQNYGVGPEDARLIQIVFGTGSLEAPCQP